MFGCYVSAEIYVIVHVTQGLVTNANHCTSQVPNELSLRHLVLNMRTHEVNTQENQRVAQHMKTVWRKDIINGLN